MQRVKKREAPEKFVNTKWGYPKEDEEKKGTKEQTRVK